MALIIQCDQCSTKYRVPKDKVPKEGIKAKCKGCGHVMSISPPEPEAPKEQPLTVADPSKDEWRCACGAVNPAEEDHCPKCKRAKILFTTIARDVPPPERKVQRIPREKAPSSLSTTWKNLLLVGALAVVLGVGISYALGYAVNRSITAFLTTIFK
jgi:predicted Zn finger-like uncharacterized protein